MDFINKYCKKYGVECVAAAEHNDEKNQTLANSFFKL